MKTQNNRKAFTLIEILLVLTLTSALLGTTIALITLAGTSNERAKQNLMRRQEIRRFADDLRRDMHQATTSDVTDGTLTLSGTSLSETSVDWKVTYQIEDESTISRIAEKSGESAPARDSYTMGESSAIEVQSIEDFAAVQWTITEHERSTTPIQIIAAQRSKQ